ncbi:MAG TPA: alpha/beta fold hydrolase [Opitutaceae bacterium]|nr:alpha/beta fold hydrolase [Opitutaceae bacterium]
MCLPHAGAGASIYFPWVHPLRNAGIELVAVQYPGREDRINEEPRQTFSDMMHGLLAAWDAMPEGPPVAIYGHSIGAVLGIELTFNLFRRNRTHRPHHVFVSGRNPPHLPPVRPKISGLPDDQFLQGLLHDYQGAIPEAVLADPEMRNIVLRVLRGDISVNEDYCGSGPKPALSIPIHAYGGRDDAWTAYATLGEWRQYSRVRGSLRMFPGDHFFHMQCGSLVVAGVISDLLRTESSLPWAEPASLPKEMGGSESSHFVP